MGIIIGSMTQMECDTIGCREKSTPKYDQREAVEISEREGWHKNQTNGKTTCPYCRGWKKRT